MTAAVLLPGRKDFDSAAFLDAAGVTESHVAQVDLSLDISTLIARGKNDDEIVEELEISLPNAKDLVAEIRARLKSDLAALPGCLCGKDSLVQGYEPSSRSQSGQRTRTS